MYEMVRLFTGHAEKMSDIMSRLSLVPKGYSLATVHRAENTDNLQNLRSIFEAFVQIGDVIVPLRPRTRKAIESEYPHFLKMVRILDPVTYFDFLVLEKNARLTLTDSGGVQKEAYFHGVPCVTLRQETEWPETLENGHNVLVGADTAEIIQATRTQSRKQLDPAGHDIFGDGSSSQKIVEYICALA